jgi:TonB family protein
MVIAASAHAFGLLGFNEKRPEIKSAYEEEETTIMMVMPPLEDLEEIELVESDGPREEIEAASFVPMLADVPSATIDTAFVQKIDYSSLAPRPDFDGAKVVTIPAGQRTGGVQPDQLKNIFNLADLDRVPEPVFQPPPVFPRTLKNEVSRATVTVEFIVGAEGKVTWAKVIDATYPGFEDAAIVGVMRWQFRPGIKGGKRVATRMVVPIIFRVVED